MQPSRAVRWLTIQAASVLALALVSGAAAVFVGLMGAAQMALVLALSAVLELAVGVVYSAAAIASWRSVSRDGRDVYERAAWARVIFGAYGSSTALLRAAVPMALTITVMFVLTQITTLLEPWWHAAVFAIVCFLALYGVSLLLVRTSPSSSVTADLRRLTGATRLPVAGAPGATRALGAASVALGFTFPPPLFVVPSETANAWVAGSRHKAIVGITSGMLAAFPPRELEAVFAALLVRIADPRVTGLPDVSSADLLGEGSSGARYGANAIAYLSAADDVAVSALREPEALVDALARTRGALDTRVPGLGARHVAALWTWPLLPSETLDGVDVEAERISALRPIAAAEVDGALARSARPVQTAAWAGSGRADDAGARRAALIVAIVCFALLIPATVPLLGLSVYEVTSGVQTRPGRTDVDVPVPPGTVCVDASWLPYEATATFEVSLAVDEVSDYYNTALAREMLASQGYTLWVDGWSGDAPPPPVPGQTGWELVRSSGRWDGSLDFLDISVEPTSAGKTRIRAVAGLCDSPGDGLMRLTGRVQAY